MRNAEERIERRLSPWLENLSQELALPGLVAAVVLGQRIVYAEGFGVAALETGEPATPQTVFHLASVSKPFVATAIMQLAQRELIDLDASVSRYIPYFPGAGGANLVTVRQMLSHTSGMPDVADYGWDQPEYDDSALERYVRGLSGVSPIDAPGSFFKYSNMAYECLGDVIAKVSGMTFEDYMQTSIFTPLGMESTTYLKSEGDLADGWAAPHLRALTAFQWKGYPYNRAHGPSSTLHSNALDMCKWGIANLAAQSGSVPGVEPSKHAELWTPHATVGWGEFGEEVGLSWFLGERNGHRLIGHTGSDTGFCSSFFMVPDSDLAVVILCSDSSAPALALTSGVLDAVLEEDMPDIRLPALNRAGKTMQEKGYEQALAEWHELKEGTPSRYDFGVDRFRRYGCIALDFQRVEDADGIVRLAIDVLSEPDLEMLHEVTEIYLAGHPDNPAAQRAVSLLRNR